MVVLYQQCKLVNETDCTNYYRALDIATEHASHKSEFITTAQQGPQCWSNMYKRSHIKKLHGRTKTVLSSLIF
jgi:hypothetical protein